MDLGFFPFHQKFGKFQIKDNYCPGKISRQYGNKWKFLNLSKPFKPFWKPWEENQIE